MDPDQDQNIGPHLDPNISTLEKKIMKKVIMKKSAGYNESMKNYPACKELKTCYVILCLHQLPFSTKVSYLFIKKMLNTLNNE